MCKTTKERRKMKRIFKLEGEFVKKRVQIEDRIGAQEGVGTLIDLANATTNELSDTNDDMLVEASIIAESQSQP